LARSTQYEAPHYEIFSNFFNFFPSELSYPQSVLKHVQNISAKHYPMLFIYFALAVTVLSLCQVSGTENEI
jgi:hypothetical protein